jgi:hypothetical protein
MATDPGPAFKVIKLARTMVQRGWCQGNEKGEQQPMDAALASAGRQLNELGSYRGLTLAVHALTAKCGDNIQSWNDTKGRTKDDVLKLMADTLEDLK